MVALPASLVRTMGIVPGGLSTFEVTSVVMLRLASVDLAEALPATLLFRGLSFWLPMIPGYWSSRRVVRPRSRPGGPATASVWAQSGDDLLG